MKPEAPAQMYTKKRKNVEKAMRKSAVKWNTEKGAGTVEAEAERGKRIDRGQVQTRISLGFDEYLLTRAQLHTAVHFPTSVTSTSYIKPTESILSHWNICKLGINIKVFFYCLNGLIGKYLLYICRPDFRILKYLKAVCDTFGFIHDFCLDATVRGSRESI